MSDNSSNSTNDNNNNTDFKTDYMADVIANSEKLKPEESRIKFDKNKDPEVIHKIHESVVETDDDYFDERSNNNNFINNNTFKEKPTNQTNNYSKNNYSKSKNKISEDEFEKSDKYKSEEFCDDDEYDDYTSLSEYKKKQRKLVLLGELGDYAKNRGIKLTKSYSINSDYYEMKHELEFHKKIINKTSAVSWMSGLLLTSVEGIELLSDNYGANYGVNIHGWSRRMDTNRKDIYEILGDLYIKYNKQGSSYSPEIRLLFILLSSLLGSQLGNMNKESDIQKTKTGVNAKSDIEMMREKAKQESVYGNTVMQDTINKEHDNVINEMKNFRDLKDIHNQNDRLNEMENIQKRYMENNIHSDNTENNRTIDIKNQLKNLRTDINNSLDLEINNVTSDTNSSSKNKSSKNKSMYSKKSFKKGKGIVINSK